MTTPNHKINISTPDSGQTSAPKNIDFLQQLSTGLMGGDAVYDFFSGDIQALNTLWQTVATGGDSVWLDGTGKDGTPVQYVDDGGHFLSVGAKLHDTDTIKNGTGSTSNFKQVGSAYVTLTTDQGTSLLIVNDIKYAGEGIAGIAAAPAIMAFVKPIVRAMVKFIKDLCLRMYNKIQGGTTPDPDEAEDTVDSEAQGAAEGAGEEGAEIGSEAGTSIFADVSLSILSKVGIVVAVGVIAVVLILSFLEKQMTNWVKFYNLSSIDLQFGICYEAGGTGAQIAPAPMGKTALVKKVGQAPTPPWVTSSDEVIYRSDLTVINTNVLKGIGYTLQAPSAGAFPGFKVTVDIPSAGSNSMWAGFTAGSESCEDIYDNNEGAYTTKTMHHESGAYTIHIATNQLSGKSPSPLNAEDGYNYEHLIVFTDGTYTLPS